MNDNLYREYYQWHHTFLQWYRASQSQPALLGKLEASHPTASKAKRQESTQSFFDDRIHYYNRKEKLDNQTYRYEYSPGLDDLYAVCKAHNLLPNEVLLTAQMGHRNRGMIIFTESITNGTTLSFSGTEQANPNLPFWENSKLPTPPHLRLSDRKVRKVSLTIVFIITTGRKNWTTRHIGTNIRQVWMISMQSAKHTIFYQTRCC